MMMLRLPPGLPFAVTTTGYVTWLTGFPRVLLPQTSVAYRPVMKSALALLETAWKEGRPVLVLPPTVSPDTVQGGDVGVLVEVTAVDSQSGVAVLSALCRVRVEHVSADPSGFPLVFIRAAAEVCPEDEFEKRSDRRQQLLTLLSQRYPFLESETLLHPVFDPEYPLGALCDLLAEALRLTSSQQEALLTESNVDCRCDWLIEHLEQPLPSPPVYPPVTSLN